MKRFTVKVPASTANMGPGFDTLGMALTMYNSFTFLPMDEGFEVSGVESQFCGKDNLVYQSFLKAYERLGKQAPGIRIEIKSDIPISRGLGSSSTCIVAGVMAALYLAEQRVDKELALSIATEMEGHPDNVAPAIFGGLQVSLLERGRVIHQEVPIASELELAVLIPNFRLSTEKSRNVLPKSVPFSDAVYNVSRVALLVNSLSTGNLEDLDVACQDALHQMARSALIPSYDKVVDLAKQCGAKASFLSGAGPSIMFLVDGQEDFVREMNEKTDYVWSAHALKADKIGAILL
ncbi:MAG: homoserine kinase [Bacillota bacterium]|nr:homoserine kinase [Bacillota bacterium]